MVFSLYAGLPRFDVTTSAASATPAMGKGVHMQEKRSKPQTTAAICKEVLTPPPHTPTSQKAVLGYRGGGAQD